MIYEIERIEVLYKAIAKVARQLLPAQCEDLTQEVAMNLWSRREQIPRQFGEGYLHTMVRNSVCDFARKNKKVNRNISCNFDENGSFASSGELGKRLLVAEPVGNYEERLDSLRAADRALASLSPKLRVVVELEADGFDCPQIAVMIGIPEGTVRSRLYYARKQFKESKR